MTAKGELPMSTTCAPLALSFPPQQVGTSSSPQPIAITNGSTTTVNISRIIVSGTNARDFSQSNTCGTLTPGANCTISVTFTPKKTGARTAEVDITDDAGGSPQVIPLNGTGT
jgi:Abnormal spindle-like microcephaly-assoc'd, ASPM-SPD-2-Hydin